MGAPLVVNVDGQNVAEMSNDNRYDRWYEEGQAQYYLENLELSSKEARFLVAKILEQAIKDYIAYHKSEDEQEKEAWATAQGFIFDPEYLVSWGDIELSPGNLLDMIDIDIDWVREQTRRKFKKEIDGE